MRELTRGRTTFIIAQRFSTVQHADQIVVLDQGKIVERGVHRELMERSGFYAEIVRKQMRGDLREEAHTATARPWEGSAQA